VLGLAEARQVGVEGGDDGTLVTEVDLDLAEVLALLQEVGCIRVPKRMDMRGLADAAGFEREAKGALEGGAAEGFGGGLGALATLALGGKEQRRMFMAFPLFAQEQERAHRQGHVAVLVAFAGADVQEHPSGVNVGDFQAQTFAQAQATGVDGGEANAMIQGGHRGEHPAHFGGGEDHGQLELGIGANQFQFVRPLALEGFLPEDLDGADGLRAGLAGDLLVDLEMDAILTNLLGRNQIGGFAHELGELSDTGVVGLLGALTHRQKLEVIGEGI
jgi:hypothetical protein